MTKSRLYTSMGGAALSSFLSERLFNFPYHCQQFTKCDDATYNRKSCDYLPTKHDNDAMVVVNDDDDDDTLSLSSYPNFSRHGRHSLLKKYLTPQVYRLLRDRKTSSGVTIEDLIPSGVSLPLGAKPPRGVGLYAGDAECYTTFAPILDPIIAHYHDTLSASVSKSSSLSSSSSSVTYTADPSLDNHYSYQEDQNFPPKRQRLKRQVTLLRPEYVLSHKLDPMGEYILYTRMRVARSLTGFPFAPTISRADRRKIETLLRECVQDWQQSKSNNNNHVDYNNYIPPALRNGRYISLYEMTNEQHDDLIQRHILFNDPDEWALIANLGRDWPDARGLFCSFWDSNNHDEFHNHEYDHDTSYNMDHDDLAWTMRLTPQLMIWCNAEDHIRIISMSKGGDLRRVFTALVEAVSALERSLQQRGHGFCYHPVYGFLNTSPTNIGTALRASVFVKLVRLGQQPGFANLIHRLRLEAHTRYAEHDQRYTGIFDISNAERFGKSETQLINIMIQGVHKLIQLEKKLERGETIQLDNEG